MDFSVEKKNGFTLIELLVTIVVLSAGLTGIMALFENAARGALQADLNVIAANLAHEKLEQVIVSKVANGYSSVGSTPYPNETFTGDLSVYQRLVSITEVSAADLNTPFVGSGYKRIDVTVKWGSKLSERVVLSTILSNY